MSFHHASMCALTSADARGARRFPISSGFKSVNRQCASSLQSVTDIALSIKGGLIDMGIASGSESMTRDYGVSFISREPICAPVIRPRSAFPC